MYSFEMHLEIFKSCVLTRIVINEWPFVLWGLIKWGFCLGLFLITDMVLSFGQRYSVFHLIYYENLFILITVTSMNSKNSILGNDRYTFWY